jgi:hypothetical protein
VGSTPTLSSNDITHNKEINVFKLGNDGYSMTFENGHTVSVRWSSSHYITGRTSVGHVMEVMATDSSDAEVAVMGPAGEFLKTPFNEYDTVIGWQSPNQVLKIMEWADAL